MINLKNFNTLNSTGYLFAKYISFSIEDVYFTITRGIRTSKSSSLKKELFIRYYLFNLKPEFYSKIIQHEMYTEKLAVFKNKIVNQKSQLKAILFSVVSLKPLIIKTFIKDTYKIFTFKKYFSVSEAKLIKEILGYE